MLDLSDPLWCKLNSAYGFGGDIPKQICSLAAHWEKSGASDLMHGSLIHQGTCYGATYAVVPHLLEIAEPEDSVVQREEIAIFLGYLALCSFNGSQQDHLPEVSLEGLALTLESWEQTREPYRQLMKFKADTKEPEHYREIVNLEPPDDNELQKFVAIRDEFFALLPEVRSLCERAFHEHPDDEQIQRYLLSGMAAAERLVELADLLESGDEGGFTCSACGAPFDYILFEDRLAFYFQKSVQNPACGLDADCCLLDWKDGAPKRADGLVVALDDRGLKSERREGKLIDLAQQSESPKLEILLRNFLGKFTCPRCGHTGDVISDGSQSSGRNSPS